MAAAGLELESQEEMIWCLGFQVLFMVAVPPPGC